MSPDGSRPAAGRARGPKEADITFPRGTPASTAGHHLAGWWDVADARDLGPVRHAITALVTAHDDHDPEAAAAAARAVVLSRPDERLGLLFNEMAGNALRHGGPGVRADLVRCDGGWLLSVRDDGAGAPALRRQDPAAPGGHGLHLVMALSDQAGWYREHDATTVWADVRDDAPAHLLERLQPRGG